MKGLSISNFLLRETACFKQNITNSNGTGFNPIKMSLFVFIRQTKNTSRTSKVEVCFDSIETRLVKPEITDFRANCFMSGLSVIGYTVQ